MNEEYHEEPHSPVEQRTTIAVSGWTRSQIEQAKHIRGPGLNQSCDDVVSEALDMWLAEKRAS